MDSDRTYRLLLLRHAHSSWAIPGQRDHARELDDKGRRQLASLGPRAAERLAGVRSVVCSTARRARDTLAGLAAGLSPDAGIAFSDALYAHGVDAYRDAARPLLRVGPVLLVGHNPTVEAFAFSLLEDHPPSLASIAEGFGTASLAVLAGTLSADGEPDLARARLVDWIVP